MRTSEEKGKIGASEKIGEVLLGKRKKHKRQKGEEINYLRTPT